MKKTFFLIFYTIFACFLFADGFIYVPDQRPVFRQESFPLVVKYHKVNVKLKDLVAETTIEQEFFNPLRTNIEGYYFFPIPKNANIKDFKMLINGKKIAAELLTADKAKKIYEDIVAKQKDPALLEYYGQGLFRVRIFPIKARSRTKIDIVYQEVLTKENQTIEYIYPLNTEKFSAQPLELVKIDIDLISTEPLKNLYSPSHKINIKHRSKNRAKISYQAKNIKPDKDFHFYYTANNDKLGLLLLSNQDNQDEAGYFLLNISPEFGKEIDAEAKDIVFVLDISGSMSGLKLKQAKQALLFCIENLNNDDQFEIIKFGTVASSLFNNLAAKNPKNLFKAKNFIKDIEAIGGTNIEEALKMALKASSKNNKRPKTIVFITDGKPTIAETNEAKLLKIIDKQNKKNAKIFTFGIAYDLNTHLLDKMALNTKGYSSYILPEENIESKITNFYNKIRYPALTDLKISTDKRVKLDSFYPEKLPDLFYGSSLTIIGRYSNNNKTNLSLEAKYKGKTQKFIYKNIEFSKNKDNEFLPTLWATRRIAHLLEKIRLKGEDKKSKAEIIALAKRYGIITPYTSYLIIEDENENDQPLNFLSNKSLDFEKKAKNQYFSMQEKYGQRSVASSQALQNLNKSDSFEQVQKESISFEYQDNRGKSKNINSQYKLVQSKAFYKIGDFWLDAQIADLKKAEIVKILFASKEYFNLIAQYPSLSDILALGKNLKFVWQNKIYQIVES